MLDSAPLLFPGSFPAIVRARLSTLQVNLGYVCNQQCQHCHVDAGPKRTEVMQGETVDQVITALSQGALRTLDLTGGAPEMNPHFRRLVESARAMGVTVIDRCNLSILSEPGYEALAEFLAEQQVEVVASLPCYLRENVDAQRGKGVYDASLQGLRRLNALGYGQPDAALSLSLVYNPIGPYLPPDQQALEADYRLRLAEQGISFSQLLTITNMPIKRFGGMLLAKGQFDEYMQLLKAAHLDSNLAAVMCRSLLSVDWQGYVYDCDFNQMLDLPLKAQGQRLHLSELDLQALAGRAIAVGDHCFGCTAGQGSSCGGALA